MSTVSKEEKKKIEESFKKILSTNDNHNRIVDSPVKMVHDILSKKFNLYESISKLLMDAVDNETKNFDSKTEVAQILKELIDQNSEIKKIDKDSINKSVVEIKDSSNKSKIKNDKRSKNLMNEKKSIVKKPDFNYILSEIDSNYEYLPMYVDCSDIYSSILKYYTFKNKLDIIKSLNDYIDGLNEIDVFDIDCILFDIIPENVRQHVARSYYNSLLNNNFNKFNIRFVYIDGGTTACVVKHNNESISKISCIDSCSISFSFLKDGEKDNNVYAKIKCLQRLIKSNDLPYVFANQPFSYNSYFTAYITFQKLIDSGNVPTRYKNTNIDCMIRNIDLDSKLRKSIYPQMMLYI